MNVSQRATPVPTPAGPGGLTWVRDVDGLAGKPLVELASKDLFYLPFPHLRRERHALVAADPHGSPSRPQQPAFADLGKVSLADAKQQAVTFLRDPAQMNTNLWRGSVGVIHASDGHRYLTPLGYSRESKQGPWFEYVSMTPNRTFSGPGWPLPFPTRGRESSTWKALEPQVEAAVGMDRVNAGNVNVVDFGAGGTGTPQRLAEWKPPQQPAS